MPRRARATHQNVSSFTRSHDLEVAASTIDAIGHEKRREQKAAMCAKALRRLNDLGKLIDCARELRLEIHSNESFQTSVHCDNVVAEVERLDLINDGSRQGEFEQLCSPCSCRGLARESSECSHSRGMLLWRNALEHHVGNVGVREQHDKVLCVEPRRALQDLVD